jgi:hypothetical protein
MKSAKIEIMTKRLVDDLLAMNINNRPVKKAVVEKYSRDMKAGNWRVTNQGIGISNDGILIDGQHRLLALRESGYPNVECVVVYGLDQESQRVVDQHAKRDARDLFRIAFNAVVARMTPAVLNALGRFEPEYKSANRGKDASMTMDEMYDLFEIVKTSIEDVCCNLGSTTFFPAPTIAACVHLLHTNKIDIVKLTVFLNTVRVGENLTRTMPEFHLRNYLTGSRSRSGGWIGQTERYFKTKIALEAVIAGKSMGVLRI